jgi:hypothetical protein
MNQPFALGVGLACGTVSYINRKDEKKGQKMLQNGVEVQSKD